MRRLVIVALAAALIAAGATSTADAALKAGIGDQNASTFSNANFKSLHIKRTRLIVAWDAINSAAGLSRLDPWMKAAHNAHLDILIAFNPSSGSACPAKPCSIPSASKYKKAFQKFHKRYGYVKYYNFWNETNSATQPTGPTKASTIKKTVALYKAAKAVCARKCTVTGPDLLDQGVGDPRRSVRVRNQKRMLTWVNLFLRYAGAKNYPKIWGLHNYGDTNYGRSTGTSFVVNKVAKRGQIWVTETGGIYSFRLQSGKLTFKPDAKRQAKAVTNAYKIAKKFRRITRLYYYQWVKNNSTDNFDAGIVDFSGKLRPAYTSLKKLPKSIWR